MEFRRILSRYTGFKLKQKTDSVSVNNLTKCLFPLYSQVTFCTYLVATNPFVLTPDTEKIENICEPQD